MKTIRNINMIVVLLSNKIVSFNFISYLRNINMKTTINISIYDYFMLYLLSLESDTKYYTLIYL